MFPQAELNAPQNSLTCHDKKAGAIAKFANNFRSKASFPECIPMDDSQFAVISSIFTLGGLLGALCAGPISNSYGRLPAMRLSSLLYVLGSGIAALSVNIPLMAIGRLLSGVGAGASLVIVPLYIAEIAPPRERGMFGVMTQISINIGIVITQTLGYLLNKPGQWRTILAFGGVIAVVQGISLCFIPESPAWTAANKDPQKAVRILRRIRGKEVDIDEEVRAWGVDVPGSLVVEAETLLPNAATPARPGSSASKSSVKSIENIGFFEVARDPLYRPAIVVVVGVMFAQQFTGINSVMMYSVSLLTELFHESSALLTIMISLVNLFTTILCAPLSDKLGRKVCLILSISGMGLSSTALAFSMFFEIKIMSALSILCFTAAFAIGLGPIPFILASELVGQEAKGATQSWALAANWIFTFLVAQFFPIINEALHGRGLVYFIFAGLAVVSLLFVTWQVPETLGKKDVDEVWGRVRRD
jgi:MFS family permease